MSRGRWLTPDSIPSERAYCQLEIPDSEAIRALVRGALYLLSDEENYEEFGAVTAQELADEMRKTLLLFNLEDCMTFPVGACIDWPSNTIPDGWLDTNQGAVSRTTYARLFAVIGTTWGSGNGTTTFDLPHKDGRVTIGKKSGDADFDTLGETGGAKTHTLAIGEIPSHSHTVFADNSMGAGATARRVIGVTGASNVSTASAGGGGSHNNVQPYVVMNYIIKF